MAPEKVKTEDAKSGRNRNYNRYCKRTGHTKKFTGKTEALSGFIYDIGVNNQSNLYIVTTKEVAAFVRRPLKDSHDMKVAIETLKDPMYTIPKQGKTGNEAYNK